MFCGKCGKQLPDGSKFCGYCGASLEEFNSFADKAEEIKEEIVPAAEEKIEDAVESVPVVEEIIEEAAPVIEEVKEESATVVEEIKEETVPVIEEVKEEAEPVVEEIKEKATPVVEEVKTEVKNASDKAETKDETKSEKPKKEKPAYKFNFGRFLLSLLLAVILFALVFTASSITIARHDLSEDNCEDLIEDAKLEKLVLPIEGGDEMELSEYVYDLCREFDIDDDVSRSDIEDLLEEDYIKDFIEENVEEYRAYIFDGEKTEGITSKEIVKFVKKNENKIRRTIGLYGDDEFVFDYDELEDTLDESLGDDFSIEIIEENYKTEAKAVQLGLSVISQIVFVFLTVVFAVFIFIVNKKRVRNAFVYVGVPLTVAGALFLIAGIAMTVFKFFDISGVPAIASTVSGFFYESFLIIGGGLVLVGVICFIIKAIIKKTDKKANA